MQCGITPEPGQPPCPQSAPHFFLICAIMNSKEIKEITLKNLAMGKKKCTFCVLSLASQYHNWNINSLIKEPLLVQIESLEEEKRECYYRNRADNARVTGGAEGRDPQWGEQHYWGTATPVSLHGARPAQAVSQLLGRVSQPQRAARFSNCSTPWWLC